MVESYVKSRRGILEHLQQTRLNSRQFAVFHLLVLLADKATGVWWGDSVLVTTYFRDLNVKAAKTSLSELEAKGYIKRFRQQGSRSSYPILINKYEITAGGLKGRRVSAEQTVDWRHPITEEVTEAGTEARTDTVTEAGTGTGREGGPPYSRPQDLQDRESTTEQSSAERSGSAADRHASHDLEPKAKTTPKPKAKTADEIRAEVAKLGSPPLEERQKAIEAGELTHMLPIELEAAERLAQRFADLSGERTSPDPFVVFLYSTQVGPDRYSFPYIAAVLKWAFEKSDYWSKHLLSAATFCAKYDSIALQYDRFYEKAGFWPHEHDTTILDGLIPEADEGSVRDEYNIYEKDHSRWLDEQTRRAADEFVAEEDGESFDVEDVKAKDGLEYSSPVLVPGAKPVAPTPSRPKTPAEDLTHRFYMGVCKRCQKTYEAWKAADHILPCIPGGTPLESSCNCERDQFNCTFCFPDTDEIEAVS